MGEYKVDSREEIKAWLEVFIFYKSGIQCEIYHLDRRRGALISSAKVHTTAAVLSKEAFIIFYGYERLPACLSACHLHACHLKKSVEGARSPGVEITGCYLPALWVLETNPGPLPELKV